MPRPIKYTPELAVVICDRILSGRSLRAICREDADMPAASTVFSWLAKHTAFAKEYARAKEGMAESIFWDILDISDDNSNDSYLDGENCLHTNQASIARARLQVDTRKWILARMAPKKYSSQAFKAKPEVLPNPNTIPPVDLALEISRIFKDAAACKHLEEAREKIAEIEANLADAGLLDDGRDLC